MEIKNFYKLFFAVPSLIILFSMSNGLKASDNEKKVFPTSTHATTDTINTINSFDDEQSLTLPKFYRQISPFITEILLIFACLQFTNPENKEMVTAFKKFFYWFIVACGNTLLENGIEKRYGYKTTFSSKYPFKLAKLALKKGVIKPFKRLTGKNKKNLCNQPSAIQG